MMEIFINIVAGIIIDEFCDLRDIFTKDVEDEEYFCFICGLPQEELDKGFGTGFVDHIKVRYLFC